MPERAYQINGGSIAHELLEGEAILINFTTGSYYSLDGVGGVIWECLAGGPASASTLAAAVAAGYSFEAGALQEAVRRFLEELEHEGLVAPTDQDPPPLAPRLSAGPLPFEPPVLRKYTDLEALLLLDPIHDALPSGWPNAKPDVS